jgi:hypothetical protein
LPRNNPFCTVQGRENVRKESKEENVRANELFRRRKRIKSSGGSKFDFNNGMVFFDTFSNTIYL